MKLSQALLFLAAVALPRQTSAANLDVSTDYRMRAVSYTDLDLQSPSNNRSFISNNAHLGVFIKNISLTGPRGEDESMDVGVMLHGIGVAGSSTAVQRPFDTIANNYPNTSFVPFVENAYVRLHQAMGYPIEATFGQQSFAVGSGLLLADDGMGLAGANLLGSLPFWNMKADGYIFQPRNSQTQANSLMIYGLTLELPTEGVWQINGMAERDRSPQTASGGTIPLKQARRYFTSARYQINLGAFLFDGEAALERGSGTPVGPTPNDPSGSSVQYNGSAQSVKVKWRQPFPKMGEGIARVIISHGSGYSGKNPLVDDAFFPSHGHRFDGLERSGMGEFFAATPYDAFGGKSSSTASGLPQNLSGISAVDIGFTPPAWRGIAVDLDYFLFQADRNISGPNRTLGHEYDIGLRYALEKITLKVSAASFTAGNAVSANKVNARRYMFEAQGKF